jgi:hypothetical protein
VGRQEGIQAIKRANTFLPGFIATHLRRQCADSFVIDVQQRTDVGGVLGANIGFNFFDDAHWIFPVFGQRT